ncbi:MAG: acyltransferase [Atopobiaceae bacterium]|nr:acyltransferase [Atopobiaceae bacterium]
MAERSENRSEGRQRRRRPADQQRRSARNPQRGRRPVAKSGSKRPGPKKQGGPGRGRVSSVDGFRALAIMAVFCYHLDVAWLPSGHLGVVMFLVLTGYLITSSLLRKLRDGAQAVPQFWLKRLGRIWPPAAVMIAFTILACIAFNHVLLTKARPDVLPGLALCENVSYILRNVSYFEQIGGPSPLTHLWYLGVDAQFSLVWPILMVAFAAVMPSRATTRRVTLALAVASAVAMGLLYNPEAGVTRVYYGTDTRAFAPLIGAWLAYIMPIGRRPARDVRDLIESNRLAIEIAGMVSLVAIVIAMVLVPDTSILLYRGGMFVVAILTAIVISTLVLPGGLLSSVLSLPPLAWLGSRSFGIYLWHFPLIQLFGAAANTAAWWTIPVVTLLSLLLGELSYRLVERPMASGTLLSGIADRISQGPAGLKSPLMVGLGALLLVAIGDGVGLAMIPDETLVPEDAIVSTGEAADKAMDLTKKKQEEETETEETEPAEDVPAAEAVLHAPAEEKEAGIYDPVLIGDSVPGDAEAFWKAACPDGLLDSYVGRRPDQAMNVLDEYLAQGVVGKIVIIQAFSNTPVSIEELDHMVEACGKDRIVYLVNVRIPESEQGIINRRISECVAKYDNVHLINWNALSEGHGNDWLYPDGEHLTPTGQPIYISNIVDAISEDFADIGGTITRRNGSETTEGTGLSVVVDNTSQASSSDATGAVAQADENASSDSKSSSQSGSKDETEEGDSDLKLVQASAPLRILMLGNSFTYYNNMPAMLAKMTGAEVVTHTKGGAHLSEQLDPNTKIGASTLQALDEGDWDYVVLQEQSAQPIKSDEPEYLQSVTELSDRVKAIGATPIIYATWPYFDGAERLTKLGISREEMGERLESSFEQAASSTGALMANVEGAFDSAANLDMLYAEDGVHPSAIGSRLAAETIAHTIEADLQRKATSDGQ